MSFGKRKILTITSSGSISVCQAVMECQPQHGKLRNRLVLKTLTSAQTRHVFISVFTAIYYFQYSITDGVNIFLGPFSSRGSRLVLSCKCRTYNATGFRRIQNNQLQLFCLWKYLRFIYCMTSLLQYMNAVIFQKKACMHALYA